ncbi:unnamed protein product [Symbiodinium natans]|uniref:Uncharacterized protein n=1 Tax=Symbiodinium natans TaxID=878477 RepID=A0A812LSY2_9DINO|nr:unnamed protein product [Symbiodinium natans]
MGPSKPLMGPPQAMTRQRVNLVGIIMALFVPWFVFIAICGLWSFKLRYISPGVVIAITVSLGVLLGLYTLYRVQLSCRAVIFGHFHLVETGRFAVWLLFIAVTASIAFVLGLLMGSYNYQTNMRSIFDVVSLNSYVEVNPSTMRGQELMDAGKVQFVAGAGLDVRLANGFKNTDVFCVAPITVNNLVLASYDFWAVGKNCCSDQQADFKCGAYNSDGPKGGLRITSDEDRDFYRLAVQQAESAYAIKAIHPLFFEWTADSSKQVQDDERAGYQMFLIGIIGHFAFQAFLVMISVACFTKNSEFSDAMGQYFSLRGAEEWAETLDKTALPSIWSTATYTPLAKSRQILLTRPGNVEYVFPGTFRQGGNYVQVSEAAEVVLIVGFDADSGRCYSGVVLQAHCNFPHKFSRTVEEVTSAEKKEAPASPSDWESQDTRCPSVEKLRRECSWMSRSPSGARISPTSTLAKSASRSSGLSLEKFGELEEAPPTREQLWPCCLFYAVKEGILVHFADDIESCEEVVRSVQARYRDAQGTVGAPPNHPQVHIVRHSAGGAPPVAGRMISQVLRNDLKRDFKVFSTASQQKDFTNCVAFSMRIIKDFQLAVRGFDIVKVCQSNPALGHKTGEVVGSAWEKLYHAV